MYWRYERLDEDGNMQYCPAVDVTGEVTGRVVIGVKSWFDENPDERIARGWTKHIHYELDEIKERWPYDPQRQVLLNFPRRIDEHTVEDDYRVIDKSEEFMLMEELYNTAGFYVPTGHVILDGNGGVIV